MIIKNKIDNEPVLSNVGQVGEFRIRNSAKAFNILSSGLYANKIRAIIREYSCNAVDSHVEAGRANVPFDVHLPNAIEPWFAVRDYGVGLDENQVRNIFTTYFESTKTATDELIGGLGLGSKSAFSYTDNFTITAIKHGIKRVFTAFINDQGVPSIAPMGEEQTTDPAGVEIRFAVNSSLDFRKFIDEARYVYKHFKLRPVVSGAVTFTFIDPVYDDRDIIPGVHAVRTGYPNGYPGPSVAVMGNIEYPIDIPNSKDLGDLAKLLECNLTIEFGIGELDIQASREGLSYIPETIAAIKSKLEALNSVLATRVTEEVSAIKNLWEQAYVLEKKSQSKLWSAAVVKYITDTKHPMFDFNSNWLAKTFVFDNDYLKEKYNITIRGFYIDNGISVSARNIIPSKTYDSNGQRTNTKIYISPNTQFVTNDTTIGCLERAKYHWKSSQNTVGISIRDKIYVIDKADNTKEMDFQSFFKDLNNPPESQIRKASSLIKKERKQSNRLTGPVSIVVLQRGTKNNMVWNPAPTLDKFDKNQTYYYLPLNGHKIKDLSELTDTFYEALRASGVFTETIYGVRKDSILAIKKSKNWINLMDHIRQKLTQIDTTSVIKYQIGFVEFFKFNFAKENIIPAIDSNSPYAVMYNKFANVKVASYNSYEGLKKLCSIFNMPNVFTNLENELNKYRNELQEVSKRYPLINHLNSYGPNSNDIVEYINAIDLMKK